MSKGHSTRSAAKVLRPVSVAVEELEALAMPYEIVPRTGANPQDAAAGICSGRDADGVYAPQDRGGMLASI